MCLFFHFNWAERKEHRRKTHNKDPHNFFIFKFFTIVLKHGQISQPLVLGLIQEKNLVLKLKFQPEAGKDPPELRLTWPLLYGVPVIRDHIFPVVGVPHR